MRIGNGRKQAFVFQLTCIEWLSGFSIVGIRITEILSKIAFI